MKKQEFYNDIKTNVYYLTGLSREEWYEVGGDIAVQTSKHLMAVRCNRNIVTLYTKLNDEEVKTDITDYNKWSKGNMVTLTAEKIYKFLTVE